MESDGFLESLAFVGKLLGGIVTLYVCAYVFVSFSTLGGLTVGYLAVAIVCYLFCSMFVQPDDVRFLFRKLANRPQWFLAMISALTMFAGGIIWGLSPQLYHALVMAHF